MDSWFEFLIPIIVVVLYLLNRMWGGGGEAEGPPRDESEADEEARRIQEEIRRKIVARQQGRQLDENVAPEIGESVYTEPAAETGRTADSKRFERFDAEPEFRERESGSFQSQPAPQAPVAVPASFGGGEGRDYQAELQEQLKRVQEAKKARQQAARKAREAVGEGSAAGGGLGGPDFRHDAGQVQRRYRNYPVSRVREDLFTREGLQKAFVLKEVLGAPLALRPHGDSHAELSRD